MSMRQNVEKDVTLPRPRRSGPQPMCHSRADPIHALSVDISNLESVVNLLGRRGRQDEVVRLEVQSPEVANPPSEGAAVSNVFVRTPGKRFDPLRLLLNLRRRSQTRSSAGY